MSAMKLGIAASVLDRGPGIAAIARAVESVGFESLLVTEHTHLPVSRRDLLEDAHLREVPHLLDQFTLLGVAATVTSTLRIGTGVCLAAQHDPIMLAKQIATVDFLSNGRFLFGIAAGWLVEETKNHGVLPGLRWEIMGEKVQAMRAIWTHDEAEYHGRFVNFEPIWLWPKPVQQPHPPIMVGGTGPRSLRAAVEYGDEWMPVVSDSAELEAKLGELRALCEVAGRPMPGVTAFLWEPDEHLVTRCAELGVGRCIIYWVPTAGQPALEAFLEKCAAAAKRIDA